MKKEVKTRNSIVTACAGISFPVCMILGFFMIFHRDLTGDGGMQGGILMAAGIAILLFSCGSKEISSPLNLDRFGVRKNVDLIGVLLIVGLGIMYAFFLINTYIAHNGGIGHTYSSGMAFWMNFFLGFKVLAAVGLLIIVIRSALNSKEEE